MEDVESGAHNLEAGCSVDQRHLVTFPCAASELLPLGTLHLGPDHRSRQIDETPEAMPDPPMANVPEGFSPA